MTIYAAEFTDGDQTWISPIHFETAADCEYFAIRQAARIASVCFLRVVRFDSEDERILPWSETGALIAELA